MPSPLEQLKESQEATNKWIQDAKDAKTIERMEELKEYFESQLSQAPSKEHPQFEQRDRWEIEKKGLIKALRIVTKKLESKTETKKQIGIALIIFSFTILSGTFQYFFEKNYEKQSVESTLVGLVLVALFVLAVGFIARKYLFN